MRIAALGRTDILLNAINILNENGHDIVLIGTCNEAPEYQVGVEDFEQLATSLGAVFFNDAAINKPSNIKLLKEVHADIAVSVNWLTLIGKEVIGAFPLGILNAHCGDLPRYRGNATPNWAIINGEKEIGITIHLMDPDFLDGGPIVLKEYMPVADNTSIGDIYEYIDRRIPDIFLEAVEGLNNGTVVPVPQPEESEKALRCYPRIPSDSLIDWNMPAIYLDRLVRASSKPFNGAYTYWNGQKLTVHQAKATTYSCPSIASTGQVLWRSPATGEVAVATGDGVLVLGKIMLEGQEQSMQASKILTSNRIRLGTVVEDEIYRFNKRLENMEAIIKELMNER